MMTMTKSKGAALACMLLMLHLTSPGQNFGGGYTFVLPPADTTSQFFLPAFPPPLPGTLGFISVTPDGHFSSNGTPLRFFGTNAVADGAFPTKSKAWFIAGRLRKMGFNLVRFHHMDNPWSTQSLFGGQINTRTLNVTVLDRLDYFLAELKKNGVYADINLHVSRTFRVTDGVVDADSLPEFGKGVTYFDPVLIDLQKEYARQLLTHVNPYTGLSLVQDPVMAMVEITNENSLYRFWRDGRLKPFASGGILTVRHNAMLDTLWHSYLVAMYASTQALANAWGIGATAPGTNMIRNGSFESSPFSSNWFLEIHAPAQAAGARDLTSATEGSSSAKITVSNSDGTDWHIQWKQTGIALIKDSVYTVTFSARADTTRSVGIAVMQDGSPYAWFAGTSAAVGTSWKTYSLSFRAPATEPNTRLSFNLGAIPGSFWVDNVTMVRSGVQGLLPEETLEARTVRRIDFAECAGFSDQRVRDICAFYLKIQNDYFDAMTSFLKQDLGVRVPVSGTNWNVGAPDLAVQSRLDFMDNHSYWDHPSFPGIPWSSTDWFITNQPMVQSAGGGTIPWLLAGVGMRNKPLTFSEYNHAYPNHYQSEGMLFATAYGSFHDADAMMFFDYNGSTDDWETDKVSGYFDIHRNTAMMSLVPSCAYAFRSGVISASAQTLELNLTPDDLLLTPKHDGGSWQGPSGFSRTLGLIHRVRYGSFAAPASTDPGLLPPPPTSPYVTDTGELAWNTAGVFTVGTPRFAAMTGLLQSFPGTRAGDLTLLTGSAFGTLSWMSLSEHGLAGAGKSLLTVSSSIQNSGMVWDGVTTVHDAWGQPPTRMLPLTLLLQLHVKADSIRVYPLLPTGGTGLLTGATYFPSDTNTFVFAIDQNQSPTTWFGIEALGQGTVSSSAEPQGGRATGFLLEQNYPNPFNPSTTIRFSVPSAGKVQLMIVDVLGREIARLLDGDVPSGMRSISWDAAGKPSGAYFCILRYTSANGVSAAETKRILLVR